MHGNLYRAIEFQRAMMFLLLSLLVGVAAFNLVSALIMVVNQRRGDVAVLRTLGWRARGRSSCRFWCSVERSEWPASA